MDASIVVPTIALVGIFIVPALIGGLTIYLKHREKIAQLQAGRPSPTNADEKLIARIDALEKKCEKLQEQVTDAHALLADEQRALDQKLAQKLSEGSAAVPDDSVPLRNSVPVKTMR